MFTADLTNMAKDRYFEFGCLYDLTVQILPASGSTVLQVLKEQDFPTLVHQLQTWILDTDQGPEQYMPDQAFCCLQKSGLTVS